MPLGSGRFDDPGVVTSWESNRAAGVARARRFSALALATQRIYIPSQDGEGSGGIELGKNSVVFW